MHKAIGIYVTQEGFFLVKIHKKKISTSTFFTDCDKINQMNVKRFDILSLLKDLSIPSTSTAFSSPFQYLQKISLPREISFFNQSNVITNLLESELPYNLNKKGLIIKKKEQGNFDVFCLPEEDILLLQSPPFNQCDYVYPFPLVFQALAFHLKKEMDPTLFIYIQNNIYHLIFIQKGSLEQARCLPLTTEEDLLDEINKLKLFWNIDNLLIVLGADEATKESSLFSTLSNSFSITRLTTWFELSSTKSSPFILAFGIALLSKNSLLRKSYYKNLTSFLKNGSFLNRIKKISSTIVCIHIFFIFLISFLNEFYLEKKLENLETSLSEIYPQVELEKTFTSELFSDKIESLEDKLKTLKQSSSLFPRKDLIKTLSFLVHDCDIKIVEKKDSPLVLKGFSYVFNDNFSNESPAYVSLNLKGNEEFANKFYAKLKQFPLISNKDHILWEKSQDTWICTFYLK